MLELDMSCQLEYVLSHHCCKKMCKGLYDDFDSRFECVGKIFHPIDVPLVDLILFSTYPSTIKNEGKVEGFIGVIARKTSICLGVIFSTPFEFI